MTTMNQANGIALRIPSSVDAYDIWTGSRDAVAYDALDVVVKTPAAADRLRRKHPHVEFTRQRPIYWCDGPQGFVLHEIPDGQ